jgi:hypothetical protein
MTQRESAIGWLQWLDRKVANIQATSSLFHSTQLVYHTAHPKLISQNSELTGTPPIVTGNTSVRPKRKRVCISNAELNNQLTQ